VLSEVSGHHGGRGGGGEGGAAADPACLDVGIWWLGRLPGGGRRQAPGCRLGPAAWQQGLVTRRRPAWFTWPHHGRPGPAAGAGDSRGRGQTSTVAAVAAPRQWRAVSQVTCTAAGLPCTPPDPGTPGSTGCTARRWTGIRGDQYARRWGGRRACRRPRGPARRGAGSRSGFRVRWSCCRCWSRC